MSQRRGGAAAPGQGFLQPSPAPRELQPRCLCGGSGRAPRPARRAARRAAAASVPAAGSGGPTRPRRRERTPMRLSRKRESMGRVSSYREEERCAQQKTRSQSCRAQARAAEPRAFCAHLPSESSLPGRAGKKSASLLGRQSRSHPSHPIRETIPYRRKCGGPWCEAQPHSIPGANGHDKKTTGEDEELKGLEN